MVLAVACGNSGEEPGLLGVNTGAPRRVDHGERDGHRDDVLQAGDDRQRHRRLGARLSHRRRLARQLRPGVDVRSLASTPRARRCSTRVQRRLQLPDGGRRLRAVHQPRGELRHLLRRGGAGDQRADRVRGARVHPDLPGTSATRQATRVATTAATAATRAPRRQTAAAMPHDNGGHVDRGRASGAGRSEEASSLRRRRASARFGLKPLAGARHRRRSPSPVAPSRASPSGSATRCPMRRRRDRHGHGDHHGHGPRHDGGRRGLQPARRGDLPRRGLVAPAGVPDRLRAPRELPQHQPVRQLRRRQVHRCSPPTASRIARASQGALAVFQCTEVATNVLSCTALAVNLPPRYESETFDCAMQCESTCVGARHQRQRRADHGQRTARRRQRPRRQPLTP